MARSQSEQGAAILQVIFGESPRPHIASMHPNDPRLGVTTLVSHSAILRGGDSLFSRTYSRGVDSGPHYLTNGVVLQNHTGALHHSLESSYVLNPPMQRTPHPPDPLVLTNHLPTSQLLILRPTIPQQSLRALHHSLHIHVPHTHGFLPPIDIVCFQHRVVVWTWRDAELAGGVRGGEGGEEGGGEK